MTNLKLRSYQEECLNAINEAYRNGTTRQLVHLPMASGKTIIFSHLIQQKKCRTLVLAHTIELLEQAREKIQMICPGLSVGLVSANSKEFENQVVVSSIQSARQIENLKQLQAQNFDLLIYDEAHHAASDSARFVLESVDFWKGTKRLLVGFSATPMRNDGRGLGEVFDGVVFKKSIKWMIEEGFLCPPKGIRIATDLDLLQVVINNEDFSPNSLSKVMDTDVLNELVVSTYQERAFDRKAICFAVSIKHSKNLSERFKAYGITAESISSDTPKSERENVLQSFKEGKIQVLVNCLILTEGYNLEDIGCVILARPTQSAALYQQMAGRGLRRHPNKMDCIILDFGDKNHSLCSTALLTEDAEVVENRQHKDTIITSLAKSLPPKINQKLKRAILEFNPLGNDFFWQKDGSGYYLKGTGNKILRIIRTDEDRFDAIFSIGNQSQKIGVNLSFEYAFSAAEDFARENRSHFVLNDIESPWRKLPISDKQKDLFRSFGFRSGIEELSRGQAALIISSGVLNRKAARH